MGYKLPIYFVEIKVEFLDLLLPLMHLDVRRAAGDSFE